MSTQGFIVIGNFGLDYDPETGRYLDASTTLSLHDFFRNVSALTTALQLPIVEVFERTVVFKGTDADFKYLKKMLGTDFSLANINADSFDMMKECEYGTFTGEGQIQRTEYIGDGQILLPSRNKPKSPSKYDA